MTTNDRPETTLDRLAAFAADQFLSGASPVEAARTLLGEGLADAVRTPPPGEAAAVLGPPLACAIARRLEAAARVLEAAEHFVVMWGTPEEMGVSFPLCDALGRLQEAVRALRSLGGPPSAEELVQGLVESGVLPAKPALDAADELAPADDPADGGPPDVCTVCGREPTAAAGPYRTPRSSPYCRSCGEAAAAASSAGGLTVKGPRTYTGDPDLGDEAPAPRSPLDRVYDARGRIVDALLDIDNALRDIREDMEGPAREAALVKACEAGLEVRISGRPARLVRPEHYHIRETGRISHGWTFVWTDRPTPPRPDEADGWAESRAIELFLELPDPAAGEEGGR